MKNVVAVIVGVERSDISPDDPVTGPVNHAMHWYEWLRECGVGPDRIRVFVSPRRDDQAVFDAWKARNDVANVEPTEAAFSTFIESELPGLAPVGAGRRLLLVWSGHGVIDRVDGRRTRRVFYSDSTPDRARNLELVSFMKALGTKKYPGFVEQTLIIDACASYKFVLGPGRRLKTPTDFASGEPPSDVRQAAYFAASPGEWARTIEVADPDAHGTVAVPRFSHEILERLRTTFDASMRAFPDVVAAFEATRRAFKDAQTPVSWTFGGRDDDLSGDEVEILPDADSSMVLAALIKIADESIIRRAYEAALGGVERTQLHHDASRSGAVTMAHVLSQTTRRKDEPSAIERWALEAEAILESKHEEGLRHVDLLAWIARRKHLARIIEYRKRVAARILAENDAQSVCFVLVVETERESGQKELEGWLFGGSPIRAFTLSDVEDPHPIAPDGGGRGVALERLLDRAGEAANELGIALPNYIVQFAVSEAQLDEPLERRCIGESHLGIEVGGLYIVVRRLEERVRALASSKQRSRHQMILWQKNTSRLAERVDAVGLQFVWMSAADVVSYVQKDNPGSCIGLRGVNAENPPSVDPRAVFLAGGVPFGCWCAHACEWTDDQTESVNADLARLGVHASLQKLRQLRLRNDHPTANIRILWDDATHNPYSLQLKAAARE